MTDFDPNAPLETQEQADDYVNYCAERAYDLLGHGDTAMTFQNGREMAACLWVVSAAQLHLDPEQRKKSPALMENLAKLCHFARRYERWDESVTLRDLWISRSVCDCFAPKGRYAVHLLDTVKCSVSALILLEGHPIQGRGGLHAPDMWALIAAAWEALQDIDLSDDMGVRQVDLTVEVAQDIVDAARWQHATKVATIFGGPPPCQN